MAEQDFWNDQEEAKRVIEECNRCKSWLVPYHEVKNGFDILSELLPEALEEGEEGLVLEIEKDLERFEKQLVDLEVRRMLSSELDGKNCYVSINAGAGGTESCDWVLMLARMYSRWAAKHAFDVETVDTVDGEVAGLKSITMRFVGSMAYGYAKAEKGVHRLVRISPFDSNARRHTSFASVDVIPEIDDAIKIDISPDQLKIDTYRSSGAGGQHVNKTESAVRVTHIPTGIVVACQSERSQLQNKETCMKMLKSKLYEKEREAREKELSAIQGEKKEISWGNQIRSYVFQPYTLVKDARTGVEVGNVQAVMDGEIDPFINAYLKEFGACQ